MHLTWMVAFDHLSHSSRFAIRHAAKGALDSHSAKLSEVGIAHVVLSLRKVEGEVCFSKLVRFSVAIWSSKSEISTSTLSNLCSSILPYSSSVSDRMGAHAARRRLSEEGWKLNSLFLNFIRAASAPTPRIPKAIAHGPTVPRGTATDQTCVLPNVPYSQNMAYIPPANDPPMPLATIRRAVLSSGVDVAANIPERTPVRALARFEFSNVVLTNN